MAQRPAQTFPFTAIVGQETLKTALILNAIDARVGGVLVRGEKGTAKSTAVRALASLLPEITVVEGCAYGCDPEEPSALCDTCRDREAAGGLPRVTIRPRVVELPVSATEDRIVGTLDFEAALKEGRRAFQPGLLADAHRAILYVDEVNLLDDHLVDTLLDAAAMGVNVVEREGISVVHPARFILVGTMNPEEGELRPQLLDRFGLCVEVAALNDPEQRVEIMRRRRAFEEGPSAFAATWLEAEDELRRRIERARSLVSSVRVGDEMLYAIADLSVRAGVDGHRADTVMARAAASYAAFEGRTEATLADLEHVAVLALAHRLRRTPLEHVATDVATLRAAVARSLARGEDPDGDGTREVGAAPGGGQATIFDEREEPSDDRTNAETAQDLTRALDRTRRSLAGRRQSTVASEGRGRYVRAEPLPGDSAVSDIAIDATIRAAAMAAADRLSIAPGVTVDADHFRRRVRTRKVGASIVFCVDASGSMGANARMSAAKAAILDLLGDAYQRRDRVALVTFRGDEAQLVLAPTASVELAGLKLRDLPIGGSTPMAAGISLALDTLNSERRREPEAIGWLVLITDGRANVGLDGGRGGADALAMAERVKLQGFSALVLDTASGRDGGGAAKELAVALGGEYAHIKALSATAIEEEVLNRL